MTTSSLTLISAKVALIAAVLAFAGAAWAVSSPPVTSTVTVTSAANKPVVTGASFSITTPQASSFTVGTLSVSPAASSCAIAAGSTGTTGSFSVAQSGGNCVVSSTSLSGAGFAYLNVTATNGAGASSTTPINVQWRTFNSNVPNAIPASINLVVPAGISLTTNTIIGRIATDTTAGAPPPNNCTVSNVAFTNGSGSFTAAKSQNGYNCIISVGSTALSANGTATMTVTPANTNGNGASAAVTVMWSTLSASAPVVSQANFTLTLPVSSGTTVGSVPVTNSPTSCAISGDPGNPTPYFSIAPSGSTCVITTNKALSGNLGSPLLYVTATNASGMSIGNYVAVSLGTNSDPGTATAAATAAHNAGYTNLVLNDSSMTSGVVDFTGSGLPGFHWYGNHNNFPGQYAACDGGGGHGFMCDYADGPSVFETFPRDQANDNLTLQSVSVAGGVLSLTNLIGQVQSCDQFGRTPYNTQFPLIGHAFGGGYYIDEAVSFGSLSIGVAPESAIWSVPVSWFQNAWITNPSGTHPVEVDFAETEFGSNVVEWFYNSTTSVPGTCIYANPGLCSGTFPSDGATHHFQTLIIPTTRGSGTGTVTIFYDGVQKGQFSYTSSSGFFDLDSQLACLVLPSVANSVTQTVSSVQVWQHP